MRCEPQDRKRGDGRLNDDTWSWSIPARRTSPSALAASRSVRRLPRNPIRLHSINSIKFTLVYSLLSPNLSLIFSAFGSRVGILSLDMNWKAWHGTATMAIIRNEVVFMVKGMLFFESGRNERKKNKPERFCDGWAAVFRFPFVRRYLGIPSSIHHICSAAVSSTSMSGCEHWRGLGAHNLRCVRKSFYLQLLVEYVPPGFLVPCYSLLTIKISLRHLVEKGLEE
jgi:hypothetical protein